MNSYTNTSIFFSYTCTQKYTFIFSNMIIFCVHSCYFYVYVYVELFTHVFMHLCGEEKQV